MKNRSIACLLVLLALIFLNAIDCFAMNWTQINTNGFGNPHNQNMNGAYFNQKMYIATGGDLEEGGAAAAIKVFEYDGLDWSQVNEDGFGDVNNGIENTGMVVFNDLLYVSAKNVNGAQIWTYNGSGWTKINGPNNPLLEYCELAVYKDKLYFASGYGGHVTSNITVQVLIDDTWTDTGFDDGNANEKIDDMIVYADKLYVSTYSEGNGFQIWAYDDNAVGEKWALVADAGIDDPNNHVCLSMTVHDNRLLASTANLTNGGQLWAYDGQDWTQINESGFGSTDNLAAMAGAFKNQLFAGTYNTATGGQLWLQDGANWIQINGTADFNNTPYALAVGRFMDQLGLYVMSNEGIGIWVHAPPVANAGADQSVVEGAAVSMDGSGSTTASGDTFSWSQVSGITVTLSDTTILNPTFTAPQVTAGSEDLVFELTITDNGGHQISDQVTISVANQCTLTTTAQGNGTIVLDPAGGTYADGTTITLTAQPEAGHQFDRWENGATGTQNPLTITINQNLSVTAVFVEQTGGSGGSGGGGGCFIETLVPNIVSQPTKVRKLS